MVINGLDHVGLDRFLAFFGRADAHHLLDIVDGDFPIADLSGPSGADNGCDDGLHHVLGREDVDLQPGNVICVVDAAPVNQFFPFLKAVAFYFLQGEKLNPDLRQPIPDLLKPGKPDDGFNFFHVCLFFHETITIQAAQAAKAQSAKRNAHLL